MCLGGFSFPLLLCYGCGHPSSHRSVCLLFLSLLLFLPLYSLFPTPLFLGRVLLIMHVVIVLLALLSFKKMCVSVRVSACLCVCVCVCVCVTISLLSVCLPSLLCILTQPRCDDSVLTVSNEKHWPLGDQQCRRDGLE